MIEPQTPDRPLLRNGLMLDCAPRPLAAEAVIALAEQMISVPRVSPAAHDWVAGCIGKDSPTMLDAFMAVRSVADCPHDDLLAWLHEHGVLDRQISAAECDAIRSKMFRSRRD